MIYSLITQYLSFQATTDLYGNCTLRHSGTSAAAPEAAGVFALALEAKYVSSSRPRGGSAGYINVYLSTQHQMSMAKEGVRAHEQSGSMNSGGIF